MLYEVIKTQIVTTIKGNSEDKTIRLNVLRSLKSAIDLEVKEKYGPVGVATVGDELVEKIMVRELKKRQDSMDQYSKAGAIQLFAVESAEAAVIKSFLPEQLDKAEVEAKIDEAIVIHGKNIGPVMKDMKLWVGARFPGKELAELVKSKLQ